MNHILQLKLKVKNNQIHAENLSSVQMIILMNLMMSILNLDVVQVNN